MKFPEIKKRLADFFLNEEGRINKQSAISIGAFISGAAFFAADAKVAQGYDGDIYYPSVNCGGCSGSGTCPGWHECTGNIPTPGAACIMGISPTDDDYVEKEAYKVDGSGRIVVGVDSNAICGEDDDVPWHYNGANYSYVDSNLDGVSDKLTATHQHHGSHNSY